VGTSDASGFTITNWPVTLAATDYASVPFVGHDNGIDAPARAAIDSAGNAVFGIGIPVGGSITNYDDSGWSSSGDKGFAAGALITYITTG
jgi:hypothetical protein